MNEQDISKWGPEAIANAVEMVTQHADSGLATNGGIGNEELEILNQAIKLLREYATKQERKGNSKEKVYEAIDKYMEMLPELLDRLFPKIPERIEDDPVAVPSFPVFAMPKEKWIITQDASVNFSAMASQILCVENIIDGQGGYLHLTFQFGLDKILRGEAATKFNELWKEEMRRRKEQGRIETV